jgi:hypothetical protein
MNQTLDTRSLAKLLLIADGKLGKTFFAALCAKAGLNVLYMDGDVGSETIGKMVRDGVLTDLEASRIYLMDMRDRLIGGDKDPKFFETVIDFVSASKFTWNASKERIASVKDVHDERWEIRPAYMDHTCVLIIDSWTGLTESMMLAAANANNVDLADTTQGKMRPVYMMGGLKSTQVLQMIRSANCHVLVLGHPDEYEHRVSPEGKKVRDIDEKDMIVEWTKQIPKGTSKPAGLQIAKYFTDVAWMEMNPAGTERRLNFKVKASRVSGGHFSDTKSIVEYSFENLIKQIGGTTPGPDGAPTDHWLKIIPPIPVGEEPAAVESKVLDGTQAAPVKSGGLSGFMKKA